MKQKEIYNKLVYYFAYGMLTDPEIMPNVEMIGVGILNNFKFEIFTYANVIESNSNKVLGTLWAIDSRKLAELDQIEGYPYLYNRKTVNVVVDGKKYSSQVYTMTDATRKQMMGRSPSKQYINSIINGYRHAGIPIAQLKNGLEEI
jgi:gamma-glutamylcyclotransferase (GGCT)/AIG2-like uncharacterized protein YtfP